MQLRILFSKLLISTKDFFLLNKNLMTKIAFKVSARAGKLLGRENFSNPEGAIIELVKNCYDADAKKCIVVFDIKKTDSSIFIIDNGDGMDLDTIENQWMKIGTGNKEQDYVSTDNRIKTGAKGIGRFALDRLGFTSEMWTLSKTEKDRGGYTWRMDWKEFDDSDKSISDINADLEPQKININSLLKGYLPYSNVEEICSILDWENGTILRISNLKDEWSDADIKNVFKSLEALIPPKELNVPFDVNLFHVQKPKEFGLVETAFFNDYDYKIVASYDAKSLNIDFTIVRNELDLPLVNKKYAFLFNDKKSPYDLATLNQKEFSYSKSVHNVLKWKSSEESLKLLKDVGSFEVSFYYVKYSVSKKEEYPYKSINTQERREVLFRFGGVKIYRDSFRVRPYGDSGNDWLSLGVRRAQSPAGVGQRIGDWRVNPESTAGIITISRKTNPQLIDKSDRGALVENDAFDTFKKIITGIINEFETDRSRILHPFYLFKKEEDEKKKEQEINRRAKALADKIIQERKVVEEKIYGEEKSKDLFAEHKEEEERKTYEEAFKETFKQIDEEQLEKDNEDNVQVRALASLGLIVSSFAHELKEVRNNSTEIKSLEEIFKRVVPNNIKKSSDYVDGTNIMKLLIDDSEKIRHWVDYSLTAVKKDKRKRNQLDFSNYFRSLSKNWKAIFKDRNIDFEISESIIAEDYKFRAFEMDMDTIFTNLINNSLDAFSNLNEIRDRKVKIYLNISNSIEILYSDNGTGLSDVFVEKEEIFLPFTTSKKNKKGEDIGTGLGMYLVKGAIDDNNGTIDILDPEIGFSVKIDFPFRKR
ncbi:sensor histidine kinase [Fluviicola chungangensis]|uniref:histidine kinase n=2 Tax=Fluviicola chungangensis TaxID=2597671 RepID=A0A556MGC0_9FLAO|nr:sensor histidine kinase [Fluviicola chungangensis]